MKVLLQNLSEMEQHTFVLPKDSFMIESKVFNELHRDKVKIDSFLKATVLGKLDYSYEHVGNTVLTALGNQNSHTFLHNHEKTQLVTTGDRIIFNVVEAVKLQEGTGLIVE